MTMMAHHIAVLEHSLLGECLLDCLYLDTIDSVGMHLLTFENSRDRYVGDVFTRK